MCPICAKIEANQKALEAFHILYGYDWKHLRFIELTTPEDFIRDSEDPHHVHAKSNHAFSLAKKYMEKCHPEEPYIAWLHHWHTKNPLSSPYIHIHIVAIAAKYSGDCESLTTTYLKPKLNKSVLDRNRKLWAKLINVPVANIYYAYCPREETQGYKKTYGGPARVMHRLQYCYRRYIHDVNTYLEKNPNEPLTPERISWLEWHTQQRFYLNEYNAKTRKRFPKRVRWYGALANRNQNRYLRMDIIEERIESQLKEQAPRCPICLSLILTPKECIDLQIQVLVVPLDPTLLPVCKLVKWKEPPEPAMREYLPSYAKERKPRNTSVPVLYLKGAV
jgi:hypothetical protein